MVPSFFLEQSLRLFSLFPISLPLILSTDLSFQKTNCKRDQGNTLALTTQEKVMDKTVAAGVRQPGFEVWVSHRLPV